jgi:copper homeostasis protein
MPDRNYNLEACVTSLEESVTAQQRGADRVEICMRLETEGMTPPTELVSSLCESLTIPIRVMIRSTETGYSVHDDELNEMIHAIQELKTLPIEGFVFGILKNNRIDRPAMQLLIEAASPLAITFHKAIDALEHADEEIEWLNNFENIDTILTSGGAMRATEGIARIQEIKKLFKGNVMAGGKIVPEDLEILHSQLGLNWYHGRKIV